MTKKTHPIRDLVDPFSCWTVDLVAARLRWLMALQHQARVKKTRHRHRDLDLARQTFADVRGLLPGDDESWAIVSAVARRQSFQRCADDLASRQPRVLTGAALRKRWVTNYGPLIAATFNAQRIAVRSEDVATARATPSHGRPLVPG